MHLSTRMSTRAALGALLAAALALTACGGGGGTTGSNKPAKNDVTSVINGALSSDGPARDGGSLTVYDTSDAPSLDISNASYNVHTHTSGLVYNKLLKYDTSRDIVYGAQKLTGDLAETWDMSSDGKTWTFHLRHGVLFQNVAPVNGHEFTSADVACTMDKIHTAPGAVQAGLMSVVDTLETPDPYTAIFHLNSSFGAFDQSIASYNMEMIPCEGAHGEFDMKSTAIGTGPFTLTSWNKGVSTIYTKNPTYFEPGKPHLDKFTILIMQDTAQQLAAYRTQQIDMIAVNTTTMQQVLATNPSDLARAQLAVTLNMIYINNTTKPFDDPRVRKAIAMAWDRKGMGSQWYYDFKLSTGFPSTFTGAMTPEESDAMWPHDVEGAKKLLAEAGYPNGLDVELTITDGYGQTNVDQAQWIQADLKAIGINTTIKQLDYATWSSNVLVLPKEGQQYTLAYGPNSGLASPDEWLTSFYKSGSTRNAFNVNDAKLDQMIANQRTILDPAQRAKVLHDTAVYIGENVLGPVTGFQAAGITFQAPWVHNVYGAP
ncbi:MAG: ABC transporter substrate-binding protein, partial [Frankiaceae bacterium]|nr:ABC transporter substrate-binding protein [Frankiaceae bacterium]